MYQTFKIDLGAIKADDQQIVQPQRRISEIAIIDLPAGAAFNLRIGSGNPLIPISRPFSMEPDGDDENNSGIFWTNDTVQAGSIVTVVVAFAGSKLKPVLS